MWKQIRYSPNGNRIEMALSKNSTNIPTDVAWAIKYPDLFLKDRSNPGPLTITNLEADDSLFQSKSVNGKKVRLSSHTWSNKILKDHPEFSDREQEYLVEVRRCISDPDYVISGWNYELLALRWCEIAPGGAKYLCVVFKELNDDGFVITTFFISKLNKLLRRGVVWKKLK